MHVREDRRDGADVARRFRSPDGRVKAFDQKLVDAIIGGKDLYGRLAELGLGLLLTSAALASGALTHGRGCLLLLTILDHVGLFCDVIAQSNHAVRKLPGRA